MEIELSVLNFIIAQQLVCGFLMGVVGMIACFILQNNLDAFFEQLKKKRETEKEAAIQTALLKAGVKPSK